MSLGAKVCIKKSSSPSYLVDISLYAYTSALVRLKLLGSGHFFIRLLIPIFLHSNSPQVVQLFSEKNYFYTSNPWSANQITYSFFVCWV